MHNPPFIMISKVADALDVEPYELFIKRSDLTELPNRVNLTNRK